MAGASQGRILSDSGTSVVSVRAYDRRGPDGHVQHVRAHQRSAPQRHWEEQINPEWREQIAHEETSQADGDFGYGRRGQPGSSALGRYQLLRTPLRDAGWQDKDSNWTPRARAAGVGSDAEFLAKPDAQETALTEVMERNERQLQAKGAYRLVGRELPGLRGGTVPITESGLAAAAHREGADAVRRYLAHREANLPAPVPVVGRGDLSVFNEIERRLRAFAATPYRRVSQ